MIHRIHKHFEEACRTMKAPPSYETVKPFLEICGFCGAGRLTNDPMKYRTAGSFARSLVGSLIGILENNLDTLPSLLECVQGVQTTESTELLF
jgi:hypothetical protein